MFVHLFKLVTIGIWMSYDTKVGATYGLKKNSRAKRPFKAYYLKSWGMHL